MRVVFMGTPDFAVPSLRALVEAGHDVVAAYSQPDRPSGRGQRLQATPVKAFALECGIPVEQPERVRRAAVREAMTAYAPDLLCVAAYGKILPRRLLELPRFGAINVHASLLPRHRGAAPIQHAILAGDATTGVTIMQMNEKMDEGDILLRREIPIEPTATAGTLFESLAELGGPALVEALAAAEAGTLHPEAQDHAAATLAPMVRKEDAAMDWSRSAAEIERAVRAYHPWPCAFTQLEGEALRVHRSRCVDVATEGAAPGEVIAAAPRELVVATGDGALSLLEVQLAGRKRLDAAAFLSGRPVAPGTRLGP